MDSVMTQTELPPSDPTAVVGRRVVASLIDNVILVVLMVVLFASLASSEDQGSVFEAELVCDLINGSPDGDYLCIAADTTTILISIGDLALLGLIGLLYGFVTQMLLPSITGFSPGKAMVGLRIVHQDSFQRAGIGANLVRWLLWIVDGAPWCFPMVGLITGLSSTGHRRVGDMAAKTIVIDRKWLGQPVAIPGVNAIAPFAPAPMVAPGPLHGSPPPPTGPAMGGTAPPPPQPGVFPAGPPVAPPTTPPPVAPPAAEPSPPPAPLAPATPRPGIDAPQWDAARDTYIQWDPELSEWMEWSESSGTWIPISH
jgi:uncharacterized RDD family membrane protein YckC